MQFTDGKGRTWRPRITLGVLRDLESISGVPVLDALADAERITKDVFRNARVVSLGLWLSIQADAQARGITQADFEDSVGGPVVSDAMNAFIDSLCECFPLDVEVRDGGRPPSLSRGRGKSSTVSRLWRAFRLLADSRSGS